MPGTIANPDEVVQKVKDTPGVAAAAPLVYSQVMLSSGASVSGVVVRGVPADLEEAVIDLKAHLTSGSLAGLGAPFQVPVEGSDKDADKDGRTDMTTLSGIILGGELAKQLGLALGDPVSVVSPLGTPSPVGPIPKVKRFVLAGTFDSGMYDYDSGLLYMGLADAQKFFGLGNAITGVEIRVTDLYAADQVARRLEQTLGTPFRARDWMEVNRNLFLAFQPREGRVLHRPHAHRAGGGVQHRRDPDHGGDGKTQGHRDPQVDGCHRPEHRAHLHVEGADHRGRRHVARRRRRVRRLLDLAPLPVRGAAEGRLLRLDAAGPGVRRELRDGRAGLGRHLPCWPRFTRHGRPQDWRPWR